MTKGQVFAFWVLWYIVTLLIKKIWPADLGKSTLIFIPGTLDSIIGFVVTVLIVMISVAIYKLFLL